MPRREHIEELSASYVLGSLTEDAEGLKEFESLIESGDPLLSKKRLSKCSEHRLRFARSRSAVRASVFDSCFDTRGSGGNRHSLLPEQRVLLL